MFGTWHGGALVKVLALKVPGSHMGAGSYLAPCLWPGKAVEDGPKLWNPAPVWETQKRLLASDRHSIGR